MPTISPLSDLLLRGDIQFRHSGFDAKVCTHTSMYTVVTYSRFPESGNLDVPRSEVHLNVVLLSIDLSLVV